jgi:hypothetical protein
MQRNAPCSGKVFSVTVHSVGFGVQSRDIQADTEAWLACRDCGDYSSCYDFSMAQVALARAVSSSA